VKNIYCTFALTSCRKLDPTKYSKKSYRARGLKMQSTRALILPNEVRVFLELRKPNPDTDKIVKLGMRNFYFAGSQTIFQIAIIFVMAYMGTI
jgi:hypothetical protein